MRLLLWFLFLKIIVKINGGCPTLCNCTKNAVNCVKRNLECVPYFEKLTNNPRVIDLSNNDIAIIDLDDFSFDKSNEVLEIYLNNSNIVTIEEMAFLELIHLQELYLADNLISTLPKNLFQNTDNLIILDLSRNFFSNFPKIFCKSLEVLMLTNSGVSFIDNDALNGLPNLNLLYLQQNNLKFLNPIVFEGLPNLYHVKLNYNPWDCTCKTIKLFNYLTIKELIEINTTIQCKSDQKFVDIYKENGAVEFFKEQCKGPIEEIDKLENLTSQNTLLEMNNNTVQLKKPSPTTKTIPKEDSTYNGWYYNINIYCLFMFVALPLSFLSGFLLGRFYVTYKKISYTVGRTKIVAQAENKNLI